MQEACEVRKILSRNCVSPSVVKFREIQNQLPRKIVSQEEEEEEEKEGKSAPEDLISG